MTTDFNANKMNTGLPGIKPAGDGSAGKQGESAEKQAEESKPQAPQYTPVDDKQLFQFLKEQALQAVPVKDVSSITGHVASFNGALDKILDVLNEPQFSSLKDDHKQELALRTLNRLLDSDLEHVLRA